MRSSSYGKAQVGMRIAHLAGAAVVLVALTLWLQCAGMGVVIYWTKTIIERRTKKLNPWRDALLMVRFAAAMIALHLMETAVWACFYRWKCFSAWEASLYLSVASFSTVGSADFFLPHAWRLLEPVEALTGMLMCGMSVSGLFAILTRILHPETEWSVPLPNGIERLQLRGQGQGSAGSKLAPFG